MTKGKKTDLERSIESFSSLRGISGREDDVARLAAAEIGKYADEIRTDPLGSVHGIIRCGREGARRLLLDAHMDEIGLMVTSVGDDGFLRFCAIGGVDVRMLPASRVTVHGKRDLPGMIAAKPPHIQTADEYKLAPATEDMCIDTGLSGRRVRELVSVGDSVSFDAAPARLMNGRITSKTLDDRAGLCVIIEAARRAVERGAQCDIEIMASTQEEVGLRGAGAGAFDSGADAAIVVDVTHAKTPDCPDDRAFELGSGAAVGIGPNMDRRITARLIEIAEKGDIPFTREVMGGDTGTNAWAVQVAGLGIPCGLVSIPVRYMHTSSETADMGDMEAAAELICRFILDFGRRENG